MKPLIYLVRKDTHVWVARRIVGPSPDFVLFKHTMQHNMVFDYPCMPPNHRSGVLALSKHVELLSLRKRQDFREMVFTVYNDDPGPERQENNLLSMLESGYDWFATNNTRFPYIAVSYMQVVENPKDLGVAGSEMEYQMDYIDPNKPIVTKWDTEDKGDGLKIYRRKTTQDDMDIQKDIKAYREMMEMAWDRMGPAG